MKKLFLAAALMLSSVCAFAQSEVGTFSIQPKLGLNISTLTDIEDGADVEARLGLVVGTELGYQITDNFALTGGLLYSMQGIKVDNATMKLDYVNIPILANFYVTRGLALKVGIQPAINVNSSVSASIASLTAEEKFDAEDFDFSIPIGLSYEFSNVVLDARYNWGLTKILDGFEPKNSVLQITVGYKFEL